MPSGHPRPVPSDSTVTECIGRGCEGFWDQVAINWPVAGMVVLCLLLLWWWGCNYIIDYLEQHDLRKPKGWKHVCKGSIKRHSCLEHFNNCLCPDSVACGCHEKQVRWERKQRKATRRLARAVVRRDDRQNARRRP